jgi:hypothetical protein
MVTCLTEDREALLALFDFPAEHLDHLRTSNPIESVFATVRHRTVRTKAALSATTAKLMVFKLVTAAAKTWRRLKGENRLPKLVQGDSKTASRSSRCRTTTPPDRMGTDVDGAGSLGRVIGAVAAGDVVSRATDHVGFI